MKPARNPLLVSLLAAITLGFGVWSDIVSAGKIGRVAPTTWHAVRDACGERELGAFHRALPVAFPGNGREARHHPGQSAHRHPGHATHHHQAHNARHHLTQGTRLHLSRTIRLGYPDPWQSVVGRSPYPGRRGIVKAMSLTRGRYDGTISVRLIGNPVLADYRTAWDTLYDSIDCEPSASYEWTEALMLAYRREIGEPLLAVAEDRDAIRGLVPLTLSTEKKLGLAIHVLSPLSDRY